MILADLFNPEPKRMGYRGDRVLWRCFTPMSLDGDVIKQLKDMFESVIAPLSEHRVFRAAFQTGSGLSNGYFDVDWWREVAFPLLEERYKILKEKDPSLY
jgi:hypothetical protein